MRSKWPRHDHEKSLTNQQNQDMMPKTMKKVNLEFENKFKFEQLEFIGMH